MNQQNQVRVSDETATMQAAVYKKYGPPEVVSVVPVPKPKVAPGKILIKVRSTTVTSGDFRLRSSTFPQGMHTLGRLALGVFGPRNQILGAEFSGDIVEVGQGCTRFKVGEAVVGGKVFGCHAEYLLVKEDSALVKKPTRLTYQQGACLAFGADTALNFLQQQAHLQPGESVLIVGASGSVGSAAVQIAKILGASRVTAVCSGKNEGLVKSLGANEVVDYTREDFAKKGVTYDVIFDTTGTRNLANTEHVLNKRGRLCMAVATLGEKMSAMVIKGKNGKRACAGMAIPTAKSLEMLVGWVEEGRLHPVIDSEYSLDDIVKAHVLVSTGHKRGNVVVNIA